MRSSMKYDVDILSPDAARTLIPHWPTNVSFSLPFARLHALRHGFEHGYVRATSTEHTLILPVQWGDGRVHSVHKGHTVPFQMGEGQAQPDWREISADVCRLTHSKLYVADLAIPASMAQGLVPLPLAVFTLETAHHDITTLFGSFNKTTRNLIRRSQEQGFRVETICGSMPDEWYQLYVRHQQSMGTPPRPKAYFEDVAKVFGNDFVLIGVYHTGQLVGMNMAWCADRGLWLSINASRADYHTKHINYLLYYETIKWACEHGIDRLDFGGSSTRDGNIHNTFKLGFGASMTPLYRLIDGSWQARTLDTLSRKKRALTIRFNKFKRLWNQ